MSKERLVELLSSDEPDYLEAAKASEGQIPTLIDIVKTGGESLAPRAIYMAGLIESENITEVLQLGASSPSPVVRIATAATIGNMDRLQSGDKIAKLIGTLLKDSDVGVRKMALFSISDIDLRTDTIRSGIEHLAQHDELDEMRRFASELSDKIIK
ncbi:HEAT repeat domain-containing protein [Paenibacillus illinoisensis]|uniref:HEAT repeat domain-containing protein n=1 Tax=Paenibacillus illinoisensis TaxID=59845 RepID=UPI001C8E5D76|nr:HEAT repeat domain-containing protein [Paenibacillus illinoisensis]MBY0217777.1 HEAT repeat domain-containing protein [Paenibacillus illinoisensis]